MLIQSLSYGIIFPCILLCTTVDFSCGFSTKFTCVSSLNFSLTAMASKGDDGGDNGDHVGTMDQGKYIIYLQEQLARVNERNDKTDAYMQRISSQLEQLTISSSRPFSGSKFGANPPPLTPQRASKLDFSLPPPGAGFGGGGAGTGDDDGAGDGGAVGGAGAGGGLDGSAGLAAAILGAPLTKVLSDLTDAINPAPKDFKKGIELRPEFYVQHKLDSKPIKSLDHTKLTYKDLMYGMSQVLLYLIREDGDAMGYVDHMSFIARQAQLNCFNDHALISYDRDVVDKVIRGDLRSFVAGDTISVACNFHAGNVLAAPRRDLSKRGRGGYFRNKSTRDRVEGPESADREGQANDPFPADLCYNYNYRKCFAANCQKAHLCRSCRGKHRGLGCQEKAWLSQKETIKSCNQDIEMCSDTPLSTSDQSVGFECVYTCPSDFDSSAPSANIMMIDSHEDGFISPTSDISHGVHVNAFTRESTSDMLAGLSDDSSVSSICDSDFEPGYTPYRRLDNNIQLCPTDIRLQSRHLIGGLPSQMNLSTWDYYLAFEPDDNIRSFLHTGIYYGFDIIDDDAEIPEYHCDNYFSVCSGPAHDYISDIILQEIIEGKYVRADFVPHCVHSLGAVPKGDASYRPITDCKRPLGVSINNFMLTTCDLFSYSSVDQVAENMTPGCYMASVDIAAAYRSISVNPAHWTFQGISWPINDIDEYLIDCRLCFGLRCAPFIFTRISDFVAKTMDRLGFKCVINYLDDFLVFGSTFQDCQLAQTMLITLLGQLGFYVSWKKCSAPSQYTHYLGIIFDSINMKLLLPPGKMDKLFSELEFFENRTRATKRQLQRLCGILSYCARIIRGARTFSRRVIDLLKGLPDGNPRIK